MKKYKINNKIYTTHQLYLAVKWAIEKANGNPMMIAKIRDLTTKILKNREVK